jgi:hypothetical protein
MSGSLRIPDFIDRNEEEKSPVPGVQVERFIDDIHSTISLQDAI